jgi:hypothetical protein
MSSHLRPTTLGIPRQHPWNFDPDCHATHGPAKITSFAEQKLNPQEKI